MEDDPPTEVPEVPLPSEPPRLLQLPGRYPDSVTVQYSLAPTYNQAHHVDVNLGIRLASDGSASLSYLHPGRPAFDSTLTGKVAADGSWDRLEIPCEPAFPDDRNEGCYPDLGGYGQGLGLDGPFFGYFMLAGLPVTENGTVHRNFRIGTQTTTVWFSVVSGPDNLTIRPANLASRGLIFGFGHSNHYDPLHCTIFSAEITIERDGGIPTRCVQIEPEESFRVWNLESRNLSLDAEFVAVPVPSVSSGSVKSPRPGNGALPFGFLEALEVARQRDASIGAALDSPGTWLGTSSMVSNGSSMTGVCPACLKHEAWKWEILLETPDERLSFTVERTEDTVAGVTYTYASEPSQPQTAFPTRFPLRIEPLEAIWIKATDLLGFEPMALTYQMPFGPGRDFITLTGAAEPMMVAIFANEQGFGYLPVVFFRADGTLELFAANGAVALETVSWP